MTCRFRRFLPLIACAATLAVAAPAPTSAPPTAEAPPADWFEVEVLVFRHTHPGAGATETWPADPGRPAIESAQEPLPFAEPPVPYMALPVSASRLTTHWDKLVRSSRYEPIAYYSWLQPPVERGAAPAVRLASPAPPAPAETPTAEPAPPFAFAGDGATPPAPPLRTPLDGTATVGLARYLYVTLDLVFRPGDLAPLPDGSTAPPFRLVETRRMRSKELHYFDHPLFGAMVQITPRPAPPTTR